MPDGWSYDDPWSWLLPSLDGNEAGKLEDVLVELFKKEKWTLGEVPTAPPPVGLRA